MREAPAAKPSDKWEGEDEEDQIKVGVKGNSSTFINEISSMRGQKTRIKSIFNYF